MEKVYFEIDKDECNELAYELFCESSGFNRPGEKFVRMRKDALEIFEKLQDRIDLKSEYVYFPKTEILYDNETLTIGGEILSCKAFEQIDLSTIEGVFVYACCVGDYSFDDEGILNQVYVDLWGTSYTDSIRRLLYKRLCEKGKVSDSFGPGFYGMKLSAISQLEKILNFDKLGITVKDRAIMIPQKSCAGLYFHVNDGYKKLNIQCEACIGNQISCQFCNVLKVNEE